MLQDVQNVFLNSDDFAESIIYVPRNGTARTIKALVTRGDPEGRDEVQNGVEQMITVMVANSATTGVTFSGLINGDAFFISEAEGGTAVVTNLDQKHMIGTPNVIAQDAGSLTFRLGPK